MPAPAYYLDTEFIECAKQRTILGLPIGRPVDTIDLISLALVSADGKRTLYVLNRECELAYAWANEWVREHVLRAIYEESLSATLRQHVRFELITLQGIFHERGLSRANIAKEVLRFVFPTERLVEAWNGCHSGTLAIRFDADDIMLGLGSYLTRREVIKTLLEKGVDLTPTFYTYYGAYHWVVFCQSLFGRMNDLPAGLPMYAVDLKQEQDRQGITKELKRQLCPDPQNEHNALADARWNRHWHRVLQDYDTSYSPAMNTRLREIRARQREAAASATNSTNQA